MHLSLSLPASNSMLIQWNLVNPNLVNPKPRYSEQKVQTPLYIYFLIESMNIAMKSHLRMRLKLQLLYKMSKRAHKTLSLEEKLKILGYIGSKMYTHDQLAQEYGVGKSTIADIKRKGQELREHKRKLTMMGCKRPSKTMKMGNNYELEMALFSWFRQKREEGIPVTGKCILAI